MKKGTNNKRMRSLTLIFGNTWQGVEDEMGFYCRISFFTLIYLILVHE